MSRPSPSPEKHRDREIERLRHEAHLWLVDLAELDDSPLRQAYPRLLTGEEAARWRRFRDRRAAAEFLVGRALVRTTLSRYLPVDPAEWSLRSGRRGRLEVAAPVAGRKLRFNLSHSHGLVACLMTLSADSGVDVEAFDDTRSSVELADRVFSRAERESLEGLTPSQQRDRFHAYWTLKEAYLKARGAGLSFGLDRVSFSLPEPGRILVSFERQAVDRSDDWQFGLYRRQDRHYLAVAIRRGEHPDLVLRARQVVPLTGRLSSAQLEWIASSPGRDDFVDTETTPGR